MIEYIPSAEVRNYLKEIGYTFSDFEKATFIYQARGYTRTEILDALRELADSTDDARTKQQIHERLLYEEQMLEAFLNNTDNRNVYVVYDESGCTCGFFLAGMVALDYAAENAKKEQTSYSVEKHVLVTGSELPMQKNPWKENHNICGSDKKELVDYQGYAVGSIHLDKNGQYTYVWSGELSKEQEIDEFDKTRFENQYIDIPMPPYFVKGHPVRDIITGEYGVIETTKESMETLKEKIKNGLYVDFVDTAITIYSVTQEGVLSHEHVCPIYLETGIPKDHMLGRTIDALCTYWSGHDNRDEEETVLRACRDYAEFHRKKSPVETASSIQEILF